MSNWRGFGFEFLPWCNWHVMNQNNKKWRSKLFFKLTAKNNNKNVVFSVQTRSERLHRIQRRQVFCWCHFGVKRAKILFGSQSHAGKSLTIEPHSICISMRDNSTHYSDKLYCVSNTKNASVSTLTDSYQLVTGVEPMTFST